MHILETQRFTLRTLTEKDATERYLSWFSDDSSKRYIEYNSSSLFKLSQYIKEKNSAKDCMLLGIFFNGTHIGNIKYEPICLTKAEATMGILIGDSEWRGKGVATEVIRATAEYLKETAGITTILLGVDKDNTSAIRSYEKIGFIVYNEMPSSLYMRWQL